MPIASRRVLSFSITITLLFTIDEYLCSQQLCISDQPVGDYSQDSLIMTRGKRKKMIVRRACRERLSYWKIDKKKKTVLPHLVSFVPKERKSREFSWQVSMFVRSSLNNLIRTCSALLFNLETSIIIFPDIVLFLLCKKNVLLLC